MPFMTNALPCKCCGKTNTTFRQKWSSANKKYYIQTKCKDCEYKQNLAWRKENKEQWSKLLQKYYIKKNGPITRNMNHTDKSRRQWYLDKSTKRATRAKQARVTWDKEKTDFIYMEAHSLRKLRNKSTNFEWHVDHIIPLKGKNVCGLHVWNNFAVIPKVDNLRKGNYHSVHV